jgi:hypothetical protein
MWHETYRMDHVNGSINHKVNTTVISLSSKSALSYLKGGRRIPKSEKRSIKILLRPKFGIHKGLPVL